MKAGYSRIDISPTESVPLAGFGNTSQRMSQQVIDRLYATCLALTDEKENTVLLFHNDLIGSPRHISDPIRSAVSEATGVPVSNILVGSTHTHSAPDIWNEAEPALLRYNEALPGLLARCAVDAMADRKAARGYCARVYTENLNFVRHYILEDGHYLGDNFGTQHESPILDHATKVDNEMRLVKLVRDGGADLLMVNWQVHPLRTGGGYRTNVSSDIIGVMRDAVEAAMGCRFIYFNGGAGNVSPISRIPQENRVDNYQDHGKALAEYVLAAQYEPLKLGNFFVREEAHIEKLNRPDPSRIPAAREVSAYWERTNDWPSSVALAIEKGFSSQFDAWCMVQRHDRKDDEIDCPLTAISLGELGFAAVPYEMFDTNAKYIRDTAPFKMTFISTTTNASVMYVPSAYGFIHGCYEAACTDCKPGTGERLAGMLVRMLEEAKQE